MDAVADIGDSMYEYHFIPSLQLDGLFYPGYSNGFFGDEGTRIDFVANAGFLTSKTVKQKLTYALKLAAEHSFALDNKNSIWIDAAAATHRGPDYMRDYYEDYGGWDGVPGYNYGTLVRDSIVAGVGYQRNLKRGVISSFFDVQIRFGLRSEDFYDFIPEPAESMRPFYECFHDGHWDLGIGVGYGLSTPVGDVIIGLGINKDLLVSFYLEMK
jgi:hypothetical protein